MLEDKLVEVVEQGTLGLVEQQVEHTLVRNIY